MIKISKKILLSIDAQTKQLPTVFFQDNYAPCRSVAWLHTPKHISIVILFILKQDYKFIKW